MNLDRRLAAIGIVPRSKALRGALLMMVSALSGVVMAALIRGLSADLHPFVIAFFRSLFGIVVFLPMFVRHGVAPLRTRRAGLHVVRGCVNVMVILFSFMALSLAPLAKVTALSFTSPLFSAILAFFVLGEVVRARRIVALVIGFAGTLAIVRPGGAEFDGGAALAIGAAAASAVGVIVVKELSRTESNVTIVMYMSLIATPVLALVAFPFWRTPSAIEFAWLAGIGLAGTITHLTVNQALKETDVAYTQTLKYTQLLWAAVVGYLAFGEIADLWTWIGSLAIVASAFYIAFREHREDEVATAGKGEGTTRGAGA